VVNLTHSHRRDHDHISASRTHFCHISPDFGRPGDCQTGREEDVHSRRNQASASKTYCCHMSKKTDNGLARVKASSVGRGINKIIGETANSKAQDCGANAMILGGLLTLVYLEAPTGK